MDLEKKISVDCLRINDLLRISELDAGQLNPGALEIFDVGVPAFVRHAMESGNEGIAQIHGVGLAALASLIGVKLLL
jgi:hypothetical protein